MAAGTPVVVGQLIGKPRTVRAARKANASASIESPRQPASSALRTGHGSASASCARSAGASGAIATRYSRIAFCGIYK